MVEVWFDIGSGALAIGEPAVEELAMQAGNMAVPLGQLIAAAEFPYQKGDFPVAPPRSIDYDTGLEASRMILHALEAEHAAPLTTEHIRRAHILGLTASVRTVYRTYGGLEQLNELCGLRLPVGDSEFDDYETPTFLSLLEDAHLHKFGDVPITLAKLEALAERGLAPNYHYVLKRFGGLGPINEYLGFPDINLWHKGDFVRYGLHFIQENGVDLLNAHAINILSKKQLGPHVNVIRKQFGTFDNFKRLVLAEDQAQQALARTVLAQTAPYISKSAIAKLQADTDELRAVVARYEIVGSCVRYIKRPEHAAMAHGSTAGMVERIRSIRPTMLEAEIEMVAKQLQVHEDVWPQDRIRRSLTVTPQQVTAARQRASKKQSVYQRRYERNQASKK